MPILYKSFIVIFCTRWLLLDYFANFKTGGGGNLETSGQKMVKNPETGLLGKRKREQGSSLTTLGGLSH